MRTLALREVSLTVDAGEVLAVVGESGSGKTTLARCLLGIDRPTSGQITFDGREVTGARGSTRNWFCRRVQGVFQDPYSSLDPRWTIRRSIREALDCLGIGTRAERDARVAELLARVGLSTTLAERRPAALSGGQRQRATIAAALACEPRLLVADEPVTALDVPIQAQILNLLSELRKDLDLAIVLISHDLSVVGHVSDRVMVMHKGQVVEKGTTDEVFDHPQHPYTTTLLAAVPGVDGRRRAAVAPSREERKHI